MTSCCPCQFWFVPSTATLRNIIIVVRNQFLSLIENISILGMIQAMREAPSPSCSTSTGKLRIQELWNVTKIDRLKPHTRLDCRKVTMEILHSNYLRISWTFLKSGSVVSSISVWTARPTYFMHREHVIGTKPRLNGVTAARRPPLFRTRKSESQHQTSFAGGMHMGNKRILVNFSAYF